MATLSQAYQNASSISLWFKINSGDNLSLADVPTIIPMRWQYFKDNWDGLYITLKRNVSSYSNPDLYNAQLEEFTQFVNIQRTNSNPAFNPLSTADTFYQFYTVFDNILINSISPTSKEQTIISNTVRQVSRYSRNDFLRIKSDLESFRDRQADVIGLTDQTYNQVFNRSPIAAQVTASVPDISVLLQINNAITSVNYILANLFAVDTVLDPFTLARNNANNPEINIQNYSSGSLVKFQYGDTLEALADRYLGDPNLWINIAIANGLKPPYIDEVGKAIYLKANGGGNNIVISQFDPSGAQNQLYVNQIVYVQSNTIPFPDQRTITNLVKVPISGDIILTLDGQDNLSNYTTADQAYIRAFAPSTVNSNQFILIPSLTPLPNERQEMLPWFLEKSAEDEKRAGIDLSIADDGDLLLTSNGDYALSYGIQNSMQAIKLKLSTELGELRYHQGFGLTNISGSSNNNINAIRSTLISSINTQVSQDSRFDRVETLDVNYVANNDEAPYFMVNMQVRLAGGNRIVPISFNLNQT